MNKTIVYLLLTTAILWSAGCGSGPQITDDNAAKDTLTAPDGKTDTNMADDTSTDHGGCIPPLDIVFPVDGFIADTNPDKDTINDSGPADAIHDIDSIQPEDIGHDVQPVDLIDPDTNNNDLVVDDGGSDLPEDQGNEDSTAPRCPDDMVLIKNICMDRYEASKPDATATSPGTDQSMATSRPGVIPWFVSQMSISVRDTFVAACEAAGKRLCTADEFYDACAGPSDSKYFFGDTWNPEICNSVDTYCDDYCLEHEIASCNTNENCGYYYNCFHVDPTGAFPECTNEYGVFDVNGNVWEIVPAATERGYEVRGGAFNCGSPSLRLQCGFNATWDALMAGFRCCRDPM